MTPVGRGHRAGMPRTRALVALAAWLLAVAFVGPAHVALHHLGNADHECDACGHATDGPSWAGVCSIPGCPEPTHHHHGTPHDDGLICLACATVSLAPPAPVAIEVASTPTARVALFGDEIGAHALIDRPRARAPPANRL